MPVELATCEWSPVRYSTAIHDGAGLAAASQADLNGLLDGVESFDLDGVQVISPEGTLRIAAAVCGRRPAEVLAWVMAEEEEIREKCKRGRQSTSRT